MAAMLTYTLIRSRDGGRVYALGDQFSHSFLLVFGGLYLPLQFVKGPAVCGVQCVGVACMKAWSV
jgi:hypothetical protein